MMSVIAIVGVIVIVHFVNELIELRGREQWEEEYKNFLAQGQLQDAQKSAKRRAEFQEACMKVVQEELSKEKIYTAELEPVIGEHVLSGRRPMCCDTSDMIKTIHYDFSINLIDAKRLVDYIIPSINQSAGDRAAVIDHVKTMLKIPKEDDWTCLPKPLPDPVAAAQRLEDRLNSMDPHDRKMLLEKRRKREEKRALGRM